MKSSKPFVPQTFCVLIFCFATRIDAADIQFEALSTVDFVSPTSSFGSEFFTYGSPFEVHAIYDSSVQMQRSSANPNLVFSTVNPPTVLELTVQVGNYIATSTGGDIILRHDLLGDDFEISAIPFLGLSGPDIEGLHLQSVMVRLRDTSGTFFSGPPPEYPPEEFAIDDFTAALFELRFDNSSSEGLVWAGRLEPFTASASPIPLPPTLWLFGSGLLGLIGIARKKAAPSGAVFFCRE